MKSPSTYRCPNCDRDVLNRCISRCLYCEATLPLSFLFSKEKIAALNEEARQREIKNKRNRPAQTVDNSSGTYDIVGGIIDITSDIGGLLD